MGHVCIRQILDRHEQQHGTLLIRRVVERAQCVLSFAAGLVARRSLARHVRLAS
jgi:hypothetical protein